MTERLTSGCSRLDTILGGGLVSPSIMLLAGAPGTGKTVLAQQCAFANGRPDAPVVYLSTLTEPLIKITQFVQGLAFCEPDRIGTAVLFEDLGDVVVNAGLRAALERVTEIIARTSCAMLVIDSVKALRFAARDATDYARFLCELAGRLSALAICAVWLAEYDTPELATSPEYAIADSTVVLSIHTSGQRTNRALQVLKHRGSACRSGWHAYRITDHGLDAFPRLSDVASATEWRGEVGRVSSGIPALDKMLNDGYWPGSSTVIAGPPGSGKTVLGLHFVYRGAELGEKCTFTTLEENHVQLGRAIRSLGWDPRDDNVVLRCESPNDIYIDQWSYELLESLEATGCRRLVIDSLTDLASACEDQQRFSEFVRSLLSRCAQSGISTLLTLDVPHLFGQHQLTQLGTSHLSDHLVLLHYVRNGPKLDRAMTVLKSRANENHPETRKFVITSEGIEVGEPVPGY
ncbi:ATPase domain-containing protein [Kutzneria sp. CA-103260]|uniref:ATPase domain-containing protein n=1 Tax=Kutzneria sp. CA-103260 TaxID=2802641 RepID=UPI001BAC9FA0|nr:ATPase domain-containing protein [Kutzneria sp. CA-103260]QUQ67194.1 Circadian clock protein kinase KaiC [Kutzneria sp. CA-103260]